jgi:hypothetical protein
MGAALGREIETLPRTTAPIETTLQRGSPHVRCCKIDLL